MKAGLFGLLRAIVTDILRVFRKLGRTLLFSRGRPSGVLLSGRYASWEEARGDSKGYDDDVIFQKTKTAVMNVRHGKGRYERDSIIFDKMQYNWAILASLLWVASRNENRLHLVDFGGSLGTTYFQNQLFLTHLASLRWDIIEQKHYAEYGTHHLEDAHLHFYNDLDTYLENNNPTAILFSSVLMYVEHSYALLEKAMHAGIRFILIDRTMCVAQDEDIITVQKVPPDIYKSSFPCRVLSANKIVCTLEDRYELIVDYDGLERVSVISPALREPISFKGFIFQRKTKEGRY